jgi:hypothetical protein
MYKQASFRSLPAARPRAGLFVCGYSARRYSAFRWFGRTTVQHLITAGNTAALKMYLDRIVPVQHGSCELPPLAKPADSIGAMTAIAEAVADGELAPSEAASATRVVEAFVQAIELHDFDARITELERHDAQVARRANGTMAPPQP